MTPRFETTPLAPAPEWDLDRLVAARQVTLDPMLRDAFVAHGAAEANLERLFSGRGLCVTTGQQPGLFLGPLFTVYKALSVINLARRLTARLGQVVVPVFWVAGDDHDLAEANRIHIVNRANEVEEIRLRDRDPAAPLVPLYKERLGPALDAALRRLEETTPETEFRASIFQWIRRHYVPDRDFATAFAGALAELLGPHGLLILRSTHLNAKRTMIPWFLGALEHARALDEALQRRVEDVFGHAQHAPVTVGDGASTVMVEGPMGRDRLIVEGERFVGRRSRESWTLRDLRHLAESAPERFSPNVLLRPVVEAAVLPTIAYIAGPGELQYFPQCAPIYDALDVVPQAYLPRWSARIIETRISKVLEKYHVAPDDLVPEGRAEASLVQEDMPADATAAMRGLREAIQHEYARLQRSAVGIDPTLKKSVTSHRNAALAGVNDIEKRIITHLKKQQEILVQQIAKARHNLFPHGRPQERVFNLVPYLVRYGVEFVEAALGACEEWSRSLESATRGA